MTDQEKTKYENYPRLIVSIIPASIDGWSCDKLKNMGFEILYSEVSTICDMAIYVVKEIPSKIDLPEYVKLYKNLQDQKRVKK